MYKLDDHTTDLFEQFTPLWDRSCGNLKNWGLLIGNVWQWLLGELDQTPVQPEVGESWIEWILLEMAILPEFKTVHKTVSQDPWSTHVFCGNLSARLRAVMPPASDAIRSESEVRMEMAGMQMLADAIGSNVITMKLATMGNAIERLKRADLEYHSRLTGSATEVRDAIRAACDESLRDIGELREIECLLGGGWGKGGTSPQALSIQSKDKLHKTLLSNPTLKRILDMAGRMQRVSDRVQATRADAEHGSPVDVETGDDIKRLLPTEMAQMMMGGYAEMDFFRKYTTKSLLQFKCRDKQPLSKGPLVLVVDESGSMRDGGREEWARAIGFVLCRLAVEQDRDFRVIGFNRSIVYNDELSMEDGTLMDWVKRPFSGGGTDLEIALEAAADTVNSQLPDADVVIITDAEAGMSGPWLKRFKARKDGLQFRLTSILIAAATGTLGLERVSNVCTRVDDLSADAASVAFNV